MMQFWHNNSLPYDSLECFLSEYLDILGYPLSLLMIRYLNKEKSTDISEYSGPSREGGGYSCI